MSKILTATATGNIGPAGGNFRMGAAKLVAGTAAASATITDVIASASSTATVMLFGVAANLESVPFQPVDNMNGIVFQGQGVVSAITAGSTLIIEEL